MGTRVDKRYELFGNKLTLTELAAVADIPPTYVLRRVKAGWDAEKIVSTPVIRRASMVGRQFGRLTVVAQATSSRNKKRRWTCRCECGNEIVVLGAGLATGDTSSCGCLRRELHAVKAVERAEDLTGFVTVSGGIVLGRSENKHVGANGFRQTLWRCKCPCGGEFLALANNIKGGKHTRCGKSCASNRGQGKRKRDRFAMVGGVKLSFKEMAGCAGISEQTIEARINKGMTPEEAMQPKRAPRA